MSAVTRRPDPADVRSSSYAGGQAWMPPRGLVFVGAREELEASTRDRAASNGR